MYCIRFNEKVDFGQNNKLAFNNTVDNLLGNIKLYAIYFILFFLGQKHTPVDPEPELMITMNSMQL